MNSSNDSSLTASAQSKRNRLFARRVTNQIRIVLDLWRYTADAWSTEHTLDLIHSVSSLVDFAERFEAHEPLKIARKILQILQSCAIMNEGPANSDLSNLSDLFHALSQTATRRNDTEQPVGILSPKKPIYVALMDEQISEKLRDQLDFFGYRVENILSPEEFRKKMEVRQPAAAIIETYLASTLEETLKLLKTCDEHFLEPTPVILYSPKNQDVSTRLAASRANIAYFHHNKLPIGVVLEQLDKLTQMMPPEPYRVLIVDDSRTQSMTSQKILNNASMITEVLSNPLEILEMLEQFAPEIILMDMYMPHCSGLELAKVIRQNDLYLQIPIVFLSSERDPDKQMEAMVIGGDEFLTKPIEPRHLIAAVRSRGERARALTSMMVRDSLTGLLNHTRILDELDREVQKSRNQNTSCCFAMVDIDHFKKINDSYGHPVGDQVIRQLALFLKQRLRKSDQVGRYGGEEFAVILPNTSPEDAFRVLESLRQQFSQIRHLSNSLEFQVTVSCGMAVLREKETREQLTERADQQLYLAKKGGRNCVCSDSTTPSGEIL
ncbi:MAG: diguanylate cyclase [Pseudomonadota bacterium]